MKEEIPQTNAPDRNMILRDATWMELVLNLVLFTSLLVTLVLELLLMTLGSPMILTEVLDTFLPD